MNKIFKGLIRFLIEVIVMTVLIVGINIFTNGMYLWGLPRMKKRIFIGIFTLILVALCEMAAFAAAPYSSNLDSLSSSSDNLDVLSQEQTILDMMAFSDEAQPYAAASLDFSKAQKQYIMNSVSFYDILSLSPSSAEAFVKDDYAWTVPLEETDENYEYAVVRKLEDGEFGSSVITTLDKTTSSVAYIFHPEMLDEELADYQVDSIITVAIGDINTHVVIANTTEGLLYIPFSDRPEFLDIINGKIYSGSDFLSILEVYIQTRDPSIASGGGSASASGHSWFLLSVSLLCTACILLIYLH